MIASTMAQALAPLPDWVGRVKFCLRDFSGVVANGNSIYSDLQSSGKVTAEHLEALSASVDKFGTECLHMKFPSLSDACAKSVSDIEDKWAKLKADKGSVIHEIVDKAALAMSVAAAGRTCLMGSILNENCEQISEVFERSLSAVKSETDMGLVEKKINGLMFLVAKNC